MLEPSIKVSKARARKLLRIKVSKAWTRVGNWNTSVKLMPREFSRYPSLNGFQIGIQASKCDRFPGIDWGRRSNLRCLIYHIIKPTIIRVNERLEEKFYFGRCLTW